MLQRAAIILCLVLLLLTTYEWFYSHTYDDEIDCNASTKDGGKILRGFGFFEGKLVFGMAAFDAGHPLTTQPSTKEDLSPGFHFRHLKMFGNGGLQKTDVLGFQFWNNYFPKYHPEGFAIPCWFLMIVLAIWPWFYFRALHIRRTRVCKGLCLTCGYDLRESPTRCPECGAPSPVSNFSRE